MQDALNPWLPCLATLPKGPLHQGELQRRLRAVAQCGSATSYPRLVETLADFRVRRRAQADTLDVPGRQKALRHLVKEVRHPQQVAEPRPGAGRRVPFGRGAAGGGGA